MPLLVDCFGGSSFLFLWRLDGDETDSADWVRFTPFGGPIFWRGPKLEASSLSSNEFAFAFPFPVFLACTFVSTSPTSVSPSSSDGKNDLPTFFFHTNGSWTGRLGSGLGRTASTRIFRRLVGLFEGPGSGMVSVSDEESGLGARFRFASSFLSFEDLLVRDCNLVSDDRVFFAGAIALVAEIRDLGLAVTVEEVLDSLDALDVVDLRPIFSHIVNDYRNI